MQKCSAVCAELGSCTSRRRHIFSWSGSPVKADERARSGWSAAKTFLPDRNRCWSSCSTAAHAWIWTPFSANACNRVHQGRPLAPLGSPLVESEPSVCGPLRILPYSWPASSASSPTQRNMPSGSSSTAQTDNTKQSDKPQLLCLIHSQPSAVRPSQNDASRQQHRASRVFECL